MEVIKHRGYIGAFGPFIEELAKTQLSTNIPGFQQTTDTFHITLITKEELKQLKHYPSDILTLLRSLQADSLFAVGVGSHEPRSHSGPIRFVIIIWNTAQLIRKRLGLPQKDFHITLSRVDNHSIDKSIESLTPGTFPTDPSLRLIDALTFALFQQRDFKRAKEFAVMLCVRYPESEKGFVRLGDIAIKLEEWKLAMLSYGRALCLTQERKVAKYCQERVMECARDYTEWGAVFRDDEEGMVPPAIQQSLLSQWPLITRQAVARLAESDTIPMLEVDSRARLKIPYSLSNSHHQFYLLPRYFRWIVPFHFALMSTPRSSEDIKMLASPHIGILRVISLTEETPLPSEWFDGTPVQHTFLPIPNYEPPTLEQMDYLIRLLSQDDNSPVLVHCGGGKGRAGTVAACYIAAYGFCKPLEANPSEPAMSSSRAISALRMIRPGSIETARQEAFVHKWVSLVWKRHSVLPPLIPEPDPCPIDIVGAMEDGIDLLVLVGLPGSGKTWFAEKLKARSSKWRSISQDETRSRAAAETDIGRRGEGKVILDRCNTTAVDRACWLALASWSVNPACVFFDYSSDLCISRAQQRMNHPTLPPGGRVRNAVQSRLKDMAAPSFAEGFKNIFTARSFSAAEELVHLLSPAKLFKFPRTEHLINLGAVSADDVIATEAHLPHLIVSSNNQVVITEKIDGANIGFSLNAEREIMVQNRSHYVNSAYHEQFKKLDQWIEVHREDLYAILDRDINFPERYILFGEWMAATHSIPYTRLPNRFIAFDIYDRFEESFLSRSLISNLLGSTSISLTPVLWNGNETEMPREQGLKDMVKTSSRFYDGEVEGIYIKVERGNKVLRRSKVVRGDFISGNDHWTKGRIKWNGLLTE